MRACESYSLADAVGCSLDLALRVCVCVCMYVVKYSFGFDILKGYVFGGGLCAAFCYLTERAEGKI